MEPRIALAGARVRDHDQPGYAYLDFLPLPGADLLDPVGMVRTPCRLAHELGRALGVPQLWVKDETKQPTGTTKDRMAALVIAVFRQFGIEEFVAASTGNSATALARAVARDGAIRAHFFCGRQFVVYHTLPPSDRVSLTTVDGSYAAAGAEAARFARENGICWEGGFFNWARREGLKTAYLEAFDEMDCTPDVVVQAVSSGMGMLAAHKGVQEFRSVGRCDRMPRFLMVQQDTCAPMVRAWRHGRSEMQEEDVVPEPSGLASAILLGDSRSTYPYLAKVARDSRGGMEAVTEPQLVEARKLVSELVGLDVCYSSAATVAAVRQKVATGWIRPDEVVLVNLTGRHDGT